MNNAVFGQTMNSVRNHWDIKLVATERRRKYLNQIIIIQSFLIYHTTKFISNRNEKTEIVMNKLFCLGLSVTELSETLMYEFQISWKNKTVLCRYRQLSFIVYIKADNVYKVIVKDVENRIDTSSYDLDRSFLI